MTGSSSVLTFARIYSVKRWSCSKTWAFKQGYRTRVLFPLIVLNVLSYFSAFCIFFFNCWSFCSLATLKSMCPRWMVRELTSLKFSHCLWQTYRWADAFVYMHTLVTWRGLSQTPLLQQSVALLLSPVFQIKYFSSQGHSTRHNTQPLSFFPFFPVCLSLGMSCVALSFSAICYAEELVANRPQQFHNEQSWAEQLYKKTGIHEVGHRVLVLVFPLRWAPLCSCSLVHHLQRHHDESLWTFFKRILKNYTFYFKLLF